MKKIIEQEVWKREISRNKRGKEEIKISWEFLRLYCETDDETDGIVAEIKEEFSIIVTYKGAPI
jgi:hypothetical protein